MSFLLKLTILACHDVHLDENDFDYFVSLLMFLLISLSILLLSKMSPVVRKRVFRDLGYTFVKQGLSGH